MRKLCPTCGGRGSIDNPKLQGPMCYNGPNGETWPQVTCQTCCGIGWVENGYDEYIDLSQKLPIIQYRPEIVTITN